MFLGSTTCAINLHHTDDQPGKNVCDQSPLHTRSAKKKRVINNSIAHSSFLLNVCHSHLITHASKLLTVCYVVRIANVWYFLD